MRFRIKGYALETKPISGGCWGGVERGIAWSCMTHLTWDDLSCGVPAFVTV